MTPAAFDKFTQFSRRGTKVVYHVGNLHYDRLMSEPVNGIAALAMRAGEAGRVFLVQRRVREGVCAYEAVRR